MIIGFILSCDFKIEKTSALTNQVLNLFTLLKLLTAQLFCFISFVGNLLRNTALNKILNDVLTLIQ